MIKIHLFRYVIFKVRIKTLLKMFSPAHENESISLPNSSALKYKTVLTMNIKCVRKKNHLLQT